MVIQCPACQTRFRLADEKIGPHGVQVRCSKCAHTFPVKREEPAAAPGGFQSPPVAAVDVTKSFPNNGGSRPATQLEPGKASPFAQAGADTPIPIPPAAPPQGNPFAPPPSAPSAPASNPFGAAPAANPFGAAPAANPFAPPPAQKPMTPPSSIPGWGPPEPTPSVPSAPPGWPSAAAPPAPPAAGAPPSAPPGMPSWMAGNAAGDGGAPSADLPGDPFAAITGGAAPPDPMSGMDQASPELDPGVRAALLGGATPDLTGDPNGSMQLSSDIAPAMGTHAPPPSSGPARGVEAPWQQSGGTAKERVAIAVEERRKKERRKKGREVLSIKVDAPREPRAAYRLLMLLFFAGAGLGAFASLTDGSFDPKRLDRARLSLLTGESPAAAPGVEGITLSGLDGGFVDTDPGRPRLFVASGVASNHGTDTKGKLRVRGILRDPSGKEIAASGELWCGNTFRDDQLKDFRSVKELTNAYTDVGDRNSNLKILPGGHVPCTVVFFDAPQPQAVSDFELEIVAAQSLSG